MKPKLPMHPKRIKQKEKMKLHRHNMKTDSQYKAEYEAMITRQVNEVLEEE